MEGARRDEIIDAATRRFGRYGYENTKWADIAADVGVGPTALYHYFESKQHCLFVILGQSMADFRARFEHLAVRRGPDYLSTLVAVLQDCFRLTETGGHDMTPIAAGLFTVTDGLVRLIGSQCGRCGTVAFPRQASCPKCTSVDVRERLLARRGTLWSWTIQCFPPKSPPYAVDDPGAFEPYGVGYVELPGEVRVEARLTEADPDRLRIGLPMELTLVPAPGGAGGGCQGGRPPVASTARGVVTYAFRPVEAEWETQQ